MKKSIIFRNEAIGDIAEAVDWYESKVVRLGFDFIQRLDSTVEKISRHPERYPIVHRKARMVPLRQFPYLVIYCVFDDFVSVIAVMHGKRHSTRWQSRLP